MKAWWRRIRPNVLSFPIFLVVRLIGMTLRIETENWPATEALPCGKILAGWHGRTFIAAIFFRGKGVWTIISQSRDGEMQNRIFTRFGFNTIRGSTKRGGIRAAVEGIRVLREGAMMALTPDGPRGPSGVVQDGVLTMAMKSGSALIPVGVSAARRKLVKTWDRYLVPGFFSRCIMIFGDPIYLAADASPEEVDAVRERLQADIHRLEQEAERRMGHAPTPLS